jgi:hypothetical protein
MTGLFFDLSILADYIPPDGALETLGLMRNYIG